MNHSPLGSEEKKAVRKLCIHLFLLTFLAGSWFFTIGSWNQISRYDAIFSFVEKPEGKRPNPDYLSFRIDHYITHELGGVNTGDFSKYKGHFYSNKAPGQLILGVLVYFPLYYFDRLVNGYTDDLWHDVKNCYILNLFTSVIPTALAVVFLFLSLMILGVPPPRSAFWSLVYGLATPAFTYSTMAWGHPLAAAFFVFAFYCYLQKGGKNVILCGLWSGLACLTDYLSALVPLLFGVLFLADALREKKSVKECFRLMFLLFCGGLLPLLLFAGYHAWNFGSPFTPATVYNNPIFLEKEKLGGTFGAFRPLVILKLLFSSQRGLFFLSPILLAAFPGFLVFRKKAPLPAWGLLGAFLLLLIANASFNGWHGGSTLSARYLIVLLPILPIFAAFLPLEKIWQKLLLGLLGLFSFLTMLAASYTSPLVGENMNDPFFDYVLPKFFRFPAGMPPSPNTLRAYEMIPDLKWEALKQSVFSPGEFLGLSGHTSVLLLLGLLALLGYFVWRICRAMAKEPAATVPLPPPLPEEKETGRKNILLYLLPLLVFLLLFLFPGDEVWINDEPQLIARALQANEANIFAASGLQGTFHIQYGPLAVWIYQLLLLLTSNVLLLVTLKTLLTVGLLYYAVRKIAPLCKLDLFTALAFLLATPFLWHFARKLWDNVFLFPMGFLLAAFLLEYFKTGKFRELFKCALTGSLMVFLHPLATPIAAAVPFVLLFRKEKMGKKLRDFFASGVILLLLPAWFFLPQIVRQSSRFAGRLSGGNMPERTVFWDLFTGIFRTFSGSGFRKEFLMGYEGLLPGIWECSLTCLLLLAVAGAALAGGIFLWKKLFREKEYCPLYLLGLWALLALIFKWIFDCVLRLPPYFHYFTAGLPPLAILIFIGLGSWKERYRRIFLQSFLLLSLLLTGSIFFLIHTWEGTRSYVYGATLENQYKVARVFVRENKAGRIRQLENRIGNYSGFPFAFQTLVKLGNLVYDPIPQRPGEVKAEYLLHYVSENPVHGGITISRKENDTWKDLLAEEK